MPIIIRLDYAQPLLPSRCVAAGQCLTLVLHGDDGCVDDFSAVSVSPRPALTVQVQHLEPLLHVGDHSRLYCLLSGHKKQFHDSYSSH